LEIIDIILGAVLLYSAWKGYQSGLLIQILTLLAWVVALISAFQLMHLSVTFLSDHWNVKGSSVPLIGFLVVFIIVLILMILLSKWLCHVIHTTLLGTFDQYAGAIIGLMKAAFGLGAFLWLLHKSSLQLPNEYVDDAFLYPWLITFTPKFIQWVSMIIPFSDILTKVSGWIHL
jgi:membrane protein required for colicin V production